VSSLLLVLDFDDLVTKHYDIHTLPVVPDKVEIRNVNCLATDFDGRANTLKGDDLVDVNLDGHDVSVVAVRSGLKDDTTTVPMLYAGVVACATTTVVIVCAPLAAERMLERSKMLLGGLLGELGPANIDTTFVSLLGDRPKRC
jgi:hypothetical protein